MDGAEQELTYEVERISCASCSALITEELEELAGVEGVEVDVASKRVHVRGPIADEQVRALLQELGYPAVPAS